MSNTTVLVLQPPSPPFLNVMRDYAGEYGVAGESTRADYGHEGAPVPNMSLLYGAAILLRDGYEVRFIDGQALRLNLVETVNLIKDTNPGVIVAALSLPSLHGDLALLHAVRQELPSAHVVCLGTVCKQLFSTILESPDITAVIRGDTETVISPLIKAVLERRYLGEVRGIAYREPDGTVITTLAAEPLTDLDSLPLLPYHLFPISRYWHGSFGKNVRYMEIMDSRGCPYQCGRYCPYPFAFGRKTLSMSPGKAVDEVERLHRDHGVDGFIFRSQNFTMIRKHAEGICNELLHRNLRVRWLCETRLDCVDKPLLELMKQAGCEGIHYGMESGDPEQFKAVGKPGCDLADLGSAIADTKAAGMHARVNVVLGLPGESWKTVRNTIRTLRAWRPSSILAAVITPYPGTDLFNEARQKGLLLTEDWSKYTGFHPVMRTEFMSSTDLMKAKRAVEYCLVDTGLIGRAVRKATRVFRSWRKQYAGKDSCHEYAKR